VELGRRLREVRVKRGLSLYQVAERLGLHVSTIGKYERAVRQPSVAVLRRLARVYDVDLGELLEPGEEALLADAAQRRRERPDLQLLLEIARRLRPEQVLLLADLLRTMTDPGRRPQQSVSTRGQPLAAGGSGSAPVSAAGAAEAQRPLWPGGSPGKPGPGGPPAGPGRVGTAVPQPPPQRRRRTRALLRPQAAALRLPVVLPPGAVGRQGHRRRPL
jgi:transcriptional regulator with XRE-family HTH domain